MSTVKLVTSEGEVVEVDIGVISISDLIQGYIDKSGDKEEIPLPRVKKAVLEKVIEYCTHAKDNPLPDIEKPLRSTIMTDVTTSWYAEYVNIDQEILFELILAADTL